MLFRSEVAELVKEKIKEIAPSLPEGSSLEVSFDRSTYIEAAIYEVYKTIIIAITLVIIIIFQIGRASCRERV